MIRFFRDLHQKESSDHISRATGRHDLPGGAQLANYALLFVNHTNLYQTAGGRHGRVRSELIGSRNLPGA